MRYGVKTSLVLRRRQPLQGLHRRRKVLVHANWATLRRIPTQQQHVSTLDRTWNKSHNAPFAVERHFPQRGDFVETIWGRCGECDSLEITGSMRKPSPPAVCSFWWCALGFESVLLSIKRTRPVKCRPNFASQAERDSWLREYDATDLPEDVHGFLDFYRARRQRMRPRLAALLGTDLTMEGADRGTDEAGLVEMNPIPATNGCDGRIVSADAL